MQSLWILVSGFFFALMGVFVKLGAEQFATAELVFYRSLTTLLVALLMLRWSGIAWRSEKPWMHCKRGLTGFVSLLLFFQAIALLPLATAMTLNYTSPLFLTLITVVLLHERPRPLLLVALALGFGGTVLLLRPSLRPEEMLGGAVGLASGLFAALAYYNVRQLVRAHEPEIRVVLYFGLYATLGAALWMLASDWHPVRWSNVWILLGMGLTGTFGQLAVTRAYGHGRTVVTAALSYGTVVWGSVLGIAIWHEVLPLTSWLAMTLIMAGGVLAVATVPARSDASLTQTSD
jgi:drug/metabolite transporter (DMT)-like permease